MTLNPRQINQAANQLLANRVPGIQAPQLPIEIRPKTIDEALAIQHEIASLRKDTIGAWKCLLPPNKEQVILAPIFSDTISTAATCAVMPNNLTAQSKVLIEPEIAFVLGKDLPAKAQGYSESEIDSAIAKCHMALELMQRRFANDAEPTFYEKLADCLVNQGLYLGAEIDKTQAYQAVNIDIEVNQDHHKQTFSGRHPNQSPIKPLYWLINYMSKRGVSFVAGQAIITASYAGIIEVDFNQATTIKYQTLGQYTVEFTAQT